MPCHSTFCWYRVLGLDSETETVLACVFHPSPKKPEREDVGGHDKVHLAIEIVSPHSATGYRGGEGDGKRRPPPGGKSPPAMVAVVSFD